MPSSMSSSPRWSISCGPSLGPSLVLMDTRMPTGRLPHDHSATPSTSSLDRENAGGAGFRWEWDTVQRNATAHRRLWERCIRQEDGIEPHLRTSLNALSDQPY